jgi:hypothetical protein
VIPNSKPLYLPSGKSRIWLTLAGKELSRVLSTGDRNASVLHRIVQRCNLLRSDDTDAPSEVASGPISAEAAFMPPHLVRR